MISRNSSRLVFFLRPLYSMSVNVPCFTSFTALISWLYYIIFYRFVHGFDSIRGSLRNPVLILSNHHIVIVHKQYIRFFLLCCLPSVSVFFMSVFPILHGFFIRFSFFIIGQIKYKIIGQIKYKVGQPFLKRWILLAHMVA